MRKVYLYPILVIFILSCKNDPKRSFPEHFTGQTMGTYYSLKIPGNNNVRKYEIDSILTLFNLELSTYIDTSFISKVNDPLIVSKTCDKNEHYWFFDMINKGKDIHELSDGDFDPTVMPLVSYWGFGPDRQRPDYIKSEIDSILEFVGFDKFNVKESAEKKIIIKGDRRISLDFSAIAKGYGVDVIADFLESKGQTNFLVEIGGETITKGQKPERTPWTLGINKPDFDASLNDVLLIVKPQNMALASSGNYRNYYKQDNTIYSHTINPKSGLAIGSDLLAISVLATQCWKADAIATACMVKGLNASKEWIEDIEEVEACFFYADQDSIKYDLSTNFDKYIYK